MKILFIHPVFAPNETLFIKNLNSIKSFLAYIGQEGKDAQMKMVWGGYCAKPEYWEEIRRVIENIGAVDDFERNYGKAHVVNELYKKYADVDTEYILTCDSDILFDTNEPDMFTRLDNIFKGYKDKSKAGQLGAVSLNQRVAQCHWVDKMNCREMSGNDILLWSSNRSGIAGGCLFIRREAWDRVGGYKVMGVYSGDDGVLLRDIQRAGYHFAVTETLSIIHPHNDRKEKEYQNWKYEQIKKCQKNGLKKSDDLETDVKEADEFWKTQK